MSDEPVEVGRYSYRHEAEFAKAHLDAAGIESAIFADDAGGMEVPLSFINSVRLLVRAEDADEARRTLAGEDDGEEEGEEATV